MHFTIGYPQTLTVPAHFTPATSGYDPELMIVECARCGRPVLWEPGRSTEVLAGVGVDPIELDAHCLLLTDGCPHCRPQQKDGFNVQVFRLTPERGGVLGARFAGNA